MSRARRIYTFGLLSYRPSLGNFLLLLAGAQTSRTKPLYWVCVFNLMVIFAACFDAGLGHADLQGRRNAPPLGATKLSGDDHSKGMTLGIAPAMDR